METTTKKKIAGRNQTAAIFAQTKKNEPNNQRRHVAMEDGRRPKHLPQQQQQQLLERQRGANSVHLAESAAWNIWRSNRKKNRVPHQRPRREKKRAFFIGNRFKIGRLERSVDCRPDREKPDKNSVTYGGHFVHWGDAITKIEIKRFIKKERATERANLFGTRPPE